jgi:monofunctional biosynthetic peptidoglycan transglycosylase
MKIRAQENREQFSLRKIKYEWLALSHIPEMMQKCVILSEDASFWMHEGIDWFEVKESIKRNYKSGRFSRGASTITQQVAKNLFLSPQKNIRRKIQEWMISILLEKELSKIRILELYLNIIEWGKNIYGIQAASAEYFQKKPSQLELFEMIRLAAVLPNPLQLRPNIQSQELIWRSKIILDRLKRYNYIDEENFKLLLYLIENS